MPHSAAEKKKVITRLRRFRGQAQALETAIEEGVSCRYALQQLAALRGAVNGMMAEVLESHLRETLTVPAQSTRKTKSVEPAESAESSIDDTIALIRTYLK